jgi:hypothetical protein
VAWSTSGVLFMVRLLPIQRRLESEVNARQTADPTKSEIVHMGKKWAHWAHLTLIGILVAFCLMVLKPGLPTP